MSQSTTLPTHHAPPQNQQYRTPSPPARSGSPDSNASPGQGAINRPSSSQRSPTQSASDLRYDELITVLREVMLSTDLAVTITGAFYIEDGEPKIKKHTFLFGKANAELVAKSVLETRRLTTRIIKIAQKFNRHGPQPDKIRSIDEYLRCTIHLHHMLAEEALKVSKCLRQIEEHRQNMDKKQLSDVRVNIRSSIQQGTTAMASASFLPMVNTSKETFALLTSRLNRHFALMEHAQTWRNEILNAARDGAPMAAISMLFNLEVAADLLGPAGIAHTGKKRDQLRKLAIEYYDAAYTSSGDGNVRTPYQGSSHEDLTSTYPVNLTSAENPSSSDSYFQWCPILKRYFVGDIIRTAHIIPARTPERVIVQVLGELRGTAILNSARNLLLIHERLEMAFDKGQITIVPVARPSDSEGPTEFRVFIIDRSLVHSHAIAVETAPGERIYWSDIAKDPVLKFKNANRPGQRNLFWHFVTSLAKAKDGCYIGLTDALGEIDRKEVWHLPKREPWIARGMLRGMAEQYMMPQIFIHEATFKPDATKVRKMEDDLAALAVYKLSSPKIQSSLEDMNDSDFEDAIPTYFDRDEYYSPQTLLPLPDNPFPSH